MLSVPTTGVYTTDSLTHCTAVRAMQGERSGFVVRLKLKLGEAADVPSASKNVLGCVSTTTLDSNLEVALSREVAAPPSALI